MLFTAVKHGQFFKFCNFEARYLKNGRSYKKNYLYPKSSKSGQKCIGTKKITNIFFYYLSQNFALWQKIALTQKNYPNFFYSLDPLLSEFKVKFRGHPFAYTLTNTATELQITVLVFFLYSHRLKESMFIANIYTYVGLRF